MTTERRSVAPSGEEDLVLADLIEEFEARLRAGEALDADAFAAEHPDYAERLRGLLPGAAVLAELKLSGSGLGDAEREAGEAASPEGTLPGVLGDFRILGELGRGGMGVVYHAEQISLRRPVALKVLPAAATLDPRQRQRFHNEAQAAASLQHPHIVAVYAVGCERGIPYYAMQLIGGLPLTAIILQQTQQQSAAASGSRTADQSLASTSDSPGVDAESASREDNTTPYTSVPVSRSPSSLLDAEAVSSAVPSAGDRAYYRWVAQVGVQAAEALDHAHQMGVVHRDIKPANLLLDSKGQMWITDFGLALMRQHEGSLTQTGDIVGTLRYMSPEQALAQRTVLDHRTDVYSLGATLYELLVLQPAFVSTDRHELLRQVVHEEPPRPRQLRRAIPVDLETIVLKAVEKRPQDRYGTAQELADDLERWLRHEPIHARRPSLPARVAKWGRRNRTLVSSLAGSLAVLLVLLAVGALVYAEQQRQVAEARQAQVQVEEQARQQAEENAERMRQAKEETQKLLTQAKRANELLAGVFHDLNPRAEAKGGPSLREQLKKRLAKTAQQLEGEAVSDPLLIADLQNTLGQTLWALGEPGLALSLFRQAQATWKEQLGPDHPHTLTGVNNLATAYMDNGQLDKALLLYQYTLAKHREKLGPDHPSTLVAMNNLALAYHKAGQLDRALPLLEQILKKRQEKLGLDHPDTLTIMNNLGLAYNDVGQLDRALSLLEQTLAKCKEKLGPDHPCTLVAMNNLASAYETAGKPSKALPMLEQALAKMKEKLDADHPDTLSTMNNLGRTYRATGQLDRALPLLEQTLARMKETLSPDHPHILKCMGNLADAYRDSGQLDRALPLLEQALVKRKDKLGPDHPDTLTSMNSLAVAYLHARRLDKALPLFEQALAERKQKLGPDHPDTLGSMNDLAAAYWANGHLDRSVSLFEELLSRICKKLGPDHPDRLRAQANLGVNYRDSGRLDKALPLLEEAFERAQVRSLDTRPQLAWIRPTLAATYEQAGQLTKAEKLHRQILKQAQQQDKESPQTAALMAVVGFNLLQQKKYADAETFFRDCLLIREKKQPGTWSTFNAQSMLGGALLGQKKYAEAEPLLSKGYQGMKKQEAKIPPQGKVRLVEAAERLVQLHEATGHKEEAARWRKVQEQEQAALKEGQPSASPLQSAAKKQDTAKR